MSKGSKRRPASVPRVDFGAHWERTFGVSCQRCGGLTEAPGGSCRRPCVHCREPYPDGDCSDGAPCLLTGTGEQLELELEPACDCGMFGPAHLPDCALVGWLAEDPRRGAVLIWPGEATAL